MRLFDVLSLYLAPPLPDQCKLHLAGWDGKNHPLDVFYDGKFDEWQSWQTKKNFERDFIIALINLPGQKDKWLFAGVYRTNGYDVHEGVPYGPYKYNTTLMEEYTDLIGRLIISFQRPGRGSYLVASNWAESLLISEMRDKRMTIGDFPGYNRTCITKLKLDTIIREEIPSWKSALSSVAGVYLITDCLTGKHYVGSAYGLGGIWGRWSIYAQTGHGGNKDLERLLQEKGGDHARNFQFTVLEIADTHASKEDLIEREGYWKDVLNSREFGYNGN